MLDPADVPPAERCSPCPGLVVERRGFLGTVAAAFAAVHLPGSQTSWRDRDAGHRGFTVEEFVAAVRPLCQELLADTSRTGQDRWLFTLAGLAVRLTDVPVPELREVATGHHIGSNHGPDPFTALHWQLAPRARIRPHPHLYGNVVTLGLQGSARVRNYEVVGDRDLATEEPFVVQCTVDQVLRPGDVNVVNLERHYVHGFDATDEGARGLDITTRIADRRPTPVLEPGDAIDAEQRTFRARWRHEK